MGKRLTVDDEREIFKLWKEGTSDKKIAEKFGVHWRTIQNFRIKYNMSVKERHKVKYKNGLMSLEKMDKQDRSAYLRQRFTQSSRFNLMLDTLTADEFKVFEEEYFKIADDTDDLTHSEEQQLALAIYELVLALKCQKSRATEERLLQETRDGKHGKSPKDDPLYTTHVSDRWDKDYKNHLEMFQKFYDKLKLSREQRLQEELKLKKSFIDYAVAYSERSEQEVAAAEILELAKLKDDELKRLLDNGWLYAKFDIKEPTNENSKLAQKEKTKVRD